LSENKCGRFLSPSHLGSFTFYGNWIIGSEMGEELTFPIYPMEIKWNK